MIFILSHFMMLFFYKIFGEFVGKDEFGNFYFRDFNIVRSFRKERRWVYFCDRAISIKVPSKWFLWLHYQIDLPPSKNDMINKSYHWEKIDSRATSKLKNHCDPDNKWSSKNNLKKTYMSWRPINNE